MDITVQIRGLAEVEARLTEMEGLAGQKLVRRILRKVAKPMADQARANALAIQHSGALARSMGIVNRRPKGTQVAKIAVTSRARDRTSLWMHNTAYRRQRKGIFYGWMVDRGTVRSRSRPWFTPAVNATEGRAVSSFVTELQKALNRIAARKSKTANPDSVVPE